jgi:hypothetical protein
MTIVFSSLFHTLKGKGKSLPPTQKVNHSNEGMFSRLHLVQDTAEECAYAYHLNPLLPAVYRFSAVTEATQTTTKETPSRFILLGSGLEGEEEETRKLMASCVTSSTTPHEDRNMMASQISITIPSYDRIENTVLIEASWTSEQISATWSMEVEQTESIVATTSIPPIEEIDDKTELAQKTEEGPKYPEKTDPPPPYHEKQSSTPPPIEPPPPPILSTLRSGSSRKLVAFHWQQVSRLARFKLYATPTSSSSSSSSIALVAEFIVETSPEKRVQGSKGQLLFRDYCGREWEAVVLCSVGLLINLRAEEGSEGVM